MFVDGFDMVPLRAVALRLLHEVGVGEFDESRTAEYPGSLPNGHWLRVRLFIMLFESSLGKDASWHGGLPRGGRHVPDLVVARPVLSRPVVPVPALRIHKLGVL